MNNEAEVIEYEKRFYKHWRHWLLETNESEWQEGTHIREYKLILSMDFDTWWDKNKRRMGRYGYSEYSFIPIRTEEEFNEYRDEKVFCIDFSTPKHVLHKELDKLIAKYHTDHQSGHDIGWMLNDIEMIWNRRPTKRTVETLDLIYKVYRKTQEMEAANPDVPLYTIGFACQLRKKTDEKTKEENATKYGHKETELMSQTVSRYLKWAEEIKAQLSVGEFPYYNQK